MEIITRRQAIDNKQSRYYSGVPCKFGHVSERYTINACCIECLHPKFESTDILARRQKRVQERHDNYMRKLAINRMDRMRLGVYEPNLPLIQAFIYALAVVREPLLRPEDTQAYCKPLPRGHNTFLRAFRLHRDDFQQAIDFNRAINPLDPRSA